MEKKRNDIRDFIRAEMKYYSQVHYIDSDDSRVEYKCEYCSIFNSGIMLIKEKFPEILIYIEDGLLVFDYTYYTLK